MHRTTTPHRRSLGFAASILIVVAAATACRAASIAVVNPDFESPANSDGAINVGVLPGWTNNHLGTGGASLYGNFNPGGGTGAFYSLSDDADPNGGVLANMSGPNAGLIYSGGMLSFFEQVLGDTLQPLTRYTLTVAVGVRDSADVFGGYNVIFGTTGTPVLSFTQDSVAPGAAGGFYDVSTTFTTGLGDAELGQNLLIRLGKNSVATGDLKYTDFDNVRLVAESVPSPAAGPAAIGLLGLIAVRRRRRAA